ncbi:MAG: hypothetical protein M1826_006578 [Phylliscum demangeonii]|nr:MAG: hypothetical protein M1826_006578 [Phylliscum demangeonii]
MKFILYLIPVGTFIVRSDGLYIPRGQSEYMSRELARPNTPLMFADVAYKRTPWPSHIVKPRVQKHAGLTKRTTDEASANRQKDVGRDVDSVEQDPKIKQAARVQLKSIDDLLEDPDLHEIAQSSGYPVEELAKAKRRSLDAHNAVAAFKKELAQVEKVRKVTPEEKRQLQALVKGASQQQTMFRRMSQGFPVNQRAPHRKMSIDDFLGDPKIHEMAQSSGYPVVELAKAKRRWLDAVKAVRAFKNELAQVERVREVTPEEKSQLQALRKAASQQQTAFRRMSHGFPVDQPGPLRKSIDDLLEDPKLHEMAQSSGYPVEELAKAKRRWRDAVNAVRAFKQELMEVEKVRKVTPEEKGQLQALVKATSQKETVFRRMSQGFPVNQRVPRRKSIDDLLEDPKLHEMAQSSGYPVEELAKAKRRWLDAVKAFRAFKNELAQVERVREVTLEEKGQLQALVKAESQQTTVFRRMSQGFPVDQRVPRRKSIEDLLEDPKLHEMAQSSGYPVEELAKAKRRWLDAVKAVRAFKNELAKVERVREVTLEEKGQLQALVKAESQQVTVFRRMSQGFPANQQIPRKRMDDLLEDPKLHEMAQSSGYPVEELAKAKRQSLDARNAVDAFKKELAKVRQVTPEEKGQLHALVKAAKQRQTVFRRMSQGLPVDNIDVAALRPDAKVDEVAHPNPVASTVTYTAQEIAGYNQLFLDASNKLRAFEEQMAVAQQAGHSPTPDVKAQHRALQDDFNKKQTMWFRARDGMPVDRVVHKRREPKTAPSPETRRQEQVSQASPAKEDPSTTHPPLQMSGPRRLLDPFFLSASHLLQGLRRQWRAMPWTRYLADPRLNRVNPAELLRAEHALP